MQFVENRKCVLCYFEQLILLKPQSSATTVATEDLYNLSNKSTITSAITINFMDACRIRKQFSEVTFSSIFLFVNWWKLASPSKYYVENILENGKPCKTN